jgi:hypothetical protein
MMAGILRFLFLLGGISMACLFAGMGLFFLAWVMSRRENGWDK